MGMGQSVLDLRNVEKRYGDTIALDGLTFSVPAGSIYGFVGPNGAGKTTAMRIVLGVLEADAGEVLWDGRAIDRAARRRIGYMPEERGLYPKMCVGAQLAYLAQLHGLDEPASEAAAGRWLERLGVADRVDDPLESLSLGNQQRVQLAAALVHDPDMLVLDEPFSGLDPVGVEVLAGVIEAEARERALPVIFSSHQLELVERICDGLAIVNEGRLIASGTLNELREGRSDRRYRLELAGDAEGWWNGVAGVEAVAPDVFRLAPETSPQALLDCARTVGDIVRFGPERPSLSELFRDAVSPVDEGGRPE
jgi:ABC-2 type transport system ATP-binding protein